MPRWKKKQLDDALKELERSKGKVSVTATAKKYGIPVSTLHDHVKGKAKKVGAGKPTVLTHTEEEEIVYCCQVLQEIGFWLTKEVVSSIVIDFLHARRKQHPFASIQPGWDWWNGFLKR